MEEAKIFGMKMSSAVTILCILVVLLIILIIFIIHKMNVMARKYEMLMSGKKGADLEKIIRIRFKEMDQVKANARRVTKEHRQIKKHLSSCISKYALVKYDAFDKMAGKLSFVIALLNDENSGILLNSMHSREGCFTYAKEIVNGESYIQLSSEEKEALEQAKTVEEEIQDMTKEAEFEDADGNVLKPFRDRVIRPGDPEYGKPDTEDAIMANADGAFAGKPDIAAIPVGGVPSGNVSAGNVSSGNIAISEPDNLSYHARSTRRKSNTAAEILPEGWHHAGVRPAPHVTLPDWLLDEPDKVAHRDYSTGFYYPEHKVQQSTDRSAYFRAWLVVGEVLSWSPEDGGRVTIMSRNKIEPGQEIEFLLPGDAPLIYTVPENGLRDADGNWVQAINNPAHVFSMPCPHEVPVNAAIRSRTKHPTLKAA